MIANPDNLFNDKENNRFDYKYEEYKEVKKITAKKEIYCFRNFCWCWRFSSRSGEGWIFNSRSY